MTSKRIVEVVRNVHPHWVGDGFPVRSLFSYQGDTAAYDPFLLLDYAGPAEFSPTKKQRGVGEHPHRGFETVTIVYQGELAHRDSGGNHGVIGAGDVQWMTAASGVVHEEFHSEAFAKNGGTLEMVQLWVNLPANDKLASPRYQGILKSQIPVVDLPDQAGTARIIAGEYLDGQGPAKTFTPIHLWDLRLNAGKKVTLNVPEGYTTLLVVQRGSVATGDSVIKGVELARFDREGKQLVLEATEDAMALLLAGAPIGEPVVGQGPFVMNTPEQIYEAIVDFRSGKMGHLS